MVSVWQGNGKIWILIQAGENGIGRIEACGSSALQEKFIPCRRADGSRLPGLGLNTHPNPMPGKDRNQEWAGWEELILHKSKNQGFTVTVCSRRVTTTANYLSEKNIY